MILTVVDGVVDYDDGDGAGLLELMITMTTTVTQTQCHPPGLHILISIVLINATRDQPATNGMRQRRITNIYTLH